MKYALVDLNNIVKNIIVYDGLSEYTPEPGLRVLEINDWVQMGQDINVTSPPIVE